GGGPAVICIGGSGGGINTSAAPLLAKAGFAALSLGYFGAPGLPKEFVNLPLEYFQKATKWLLAQPVVRGPKVGVTGTSRGSEAALQLATLTHAIGAVVAYVPSNIRWMGVGDQPSWTKAGEPLPYMQWSNDFGDKDAAISKTNRFNQILDDPTLYAAAEIEVEKAKCPLLLISGKDDRLWPSERMATLITDRLSNHRYPYPYRHISYPQAGHRIKVPGLDPDSYEPISKDTVTGELLQLGGTYQGNKAASEQSWHETVEFFKSTLDNNYV
ncbi:MAG TPA: acyl-CoA thioester hydrolase/BAAT C-terminal domain-containing protein, partial [Patescibacteria group bacterium]|nr:acyl-CoA thioester hydrolase/BAAT C-terminal domain-containing protein [Patescibacteria group bacterium]